MTETDFDMIFRIIEFAYEAARALAWAGINAFTWLYCLTPSGWPDTARFAAIALMLGLAWCVVVVLRR